MSVSDFRAPAGAEFLRLADLLRYPDKPFVARTGDSAEVAEFLDEVGHVSLDGMEEIYTWTFDLNPVATQEIGWHLWGEQYERGRFLAELRALQTDLGIIAVTELPDHLTILLDTLARIPDPRPLSTKITPALTKISAVLEEQGNPYRHLIRAVIALTTAAHEPPTAGDCA